MLFTAGATIGNLIFHPHLGRQNFYWSPTFYKLDIQHKQENELDLDSQLCHAGEKFLQHCCCQRWWRCVDEVQGEICQSCPLWSKITTDQHRSAISHFINISTISMSKNHKMSDFQNRFVKYPIFALRRGFYSESKATLPGYKRTFQNRHLSGLWRRTEK